MKQKLNSIIILGAMAFAMLFMPVGPANAVSWAAFNCYMQGLNNVSGARYGGNQNMSLSGQWARCVLM